MHLIQSQDQGFWLFTQGSSILWQNGLPFGYARDLGLTGKKAVQIGQWSDEKCGQNQPLFLVESQNDSSHYTYLRDLLFLPEAQFNLLNRGVELNYFYQTHQFCGKCSAPTQITQDEFAVQCENCGYRAYPVICPSIIVAVRRGTEILLANHQRHKGGMYTTLAGFVEAGETFEQTVEREVFEETGIRVKNIRYFGSQPWAFPNSQMVGFLADYDGGEIHLQEQELCDARWFAYNQPLPKLPPQGTIALKLIQATLALCANDH